MTIQRHDRIMFNDYTYQLVGVKGRALFNPSRRLRLSLSPSSSCWRGYLCECSIHDEVLFLDRLFVCLGCMHEGRFVPESGPAISGIEPVHVGPEPLFGVPLGFRDVYQFPHRKVGFTGRLLLADEMVRHAYFSSEYFQAWQYTVVLKAVFDHGNLLGCSDVSQQMAKTREVMLSEPVNMRRVVRSGSLHYDYDL